MNCGRCSKEITDDEHEFCWYCQGDLCYKCWDEFGDCGHKEAEEFYEETERRKKAGLPLMEIPMNELDKKKARDLAVIASAANELRKGFDASADDIFELMIEGIEKFPDQLQTMVDTVVTMQKEFPFPEGGWEMFLRDLEHTNRKHGLNLHIRSELFNE